MATVRKNPAASAPVESELKQALPDTKGSPFQSATEGDLVDDDSEMIGAPNAPTAISENDIRQRAYELWESSGRRAGSEDDFWYQAREELQAAFQRGE